MSETKSVEIVVCERHGLRYNAALGQGCVRCKREAGIATGTFATAGGASVAPPAQSAGVTSAGRQAPASAWVQLLIAAALIGGAGAAFWSAHQQVLASFSVFGMGADDPTALPDAESTMGGSESAEPYDPAAPNDTVAIGPAEQQRQLDELMRQMQADDKADAESAAREAEAAGQEPGADDLYTPVQ